MLPAALPNAEPTNDVGGAALDQVFGLSVAAGVITLGLLWIAWAHRTRRIDWFQNLGDSLGRRWGEPGWVVIPQLFVGTSLVVALLGFLWDVSLHAGRGRDEGPLANPAHYLILYGLFALFIAGMSAVVWPRDGQRPGPAAVRITRTWYAPVAGIYVAACGLYALIGFPLDDVWHRLFGQDVTLWGPTHLMLIGGAGLSTAGIILLHREAEFSAEFKDPERHLGQEAMHRLTLAMGFGALLIGLSVFQAEFDFGIAQFRMVFAPFMIAVAAALVLVAARLYGGPGVALFAAFFFVITRGIVAFIVTNVFGQAQHVFPLYLGCAVVIELLALTKLKDKPLWFGAVGGFLVATAGLVTEKAWNDLVFPFPWPQDVWLESLAMSIPVAIGAGMCGALFAMGLRGRLPRARWVGRTVVVTTIALAAVAIGNGLYATVPQDASVRIETEQVGMVGAPAVTARITVEPADLIDDHPTWVQITAWQGGGEGVVLDNLRRTGRNTWESTKPVPIGGTWKTLVRIQDGRMLTAAPIYLAADEALGVPELPAEASATRKLVPEITILQRERSFDAPGWLWGAANAVVLLFSLAMLAGIAIATARVGRGIEALAEEKRAERKAGSST